MNTLKTSTRRPVRLALATMALAAAALAGTAQAAGPGMDVDGGGPGMGMGMMMGGPGGHGGHGGPGMGMMGGGRGMERMLDTVNATDAQRTQIRNILQAARTDLQGQQASRKALHDQERQAWSQPNVDANAVEALRKQKLALHDAASQRMTKARLEISRVLTPEQRKVLADKMAQRQAMMQRHQAERAALEGRK